MRRSKGHHRPCLDTNKTPLGRRIPIASLNQTLVVVEYLNFRHAANALGVAQSSVGARIKTLEEGLGFCSRAFLANANS